MTLGNTSQPAAETQKKFNPKEKEELIKRLPKRLSYVLRYGAVKEGLTVSENGYVLLDDVTRVPLLSAYSRDEIFQEVETSISYRTTRRYESREKNGRIEIRAAYLRKFEESPVHSGTQVKTLFETAMNHVIDNLDEYDLESFPDEDIIRRMLHRLKRQRRLTVKALQSLLVPTLTRLDLEGVVLTNNVLRCLYRQCPNLRCISFKGCGYIITDTVLTQLAKNLPGLEQLNLCSCNHLTTQSLNTLAKRLPQLTTLHAAQMPNWTVKSVLDFLNKAKSLTFLDVFYLRTTSEEFQQLMSVADSRNITLVLRNPKTRVPVSREEREPAADDQSGKENAEGDVGGGGGGGGVTAAAAAADVETPADDQEPPPSRNYWEEMMNEPGFHGYGFNVDYMMDED